MPRRYTEITFTPSVEEAQTEHGSRAVGAKMAARELDDHTLSWREKAFIAKRESFYMASVGQTGWPYVQFRGGAPGFLKTLGPTTLAYADFRGNKQYISMGNIRADDRVSLFFMDYKHKQRLKLLARASYHAAADRPDLLEQVRDDDYPGAVERVVVFEVEAFDWNCPQHIPIKLELAEVEAREAALHARIAQLERPLG